MSEAERAEALRAVQMELFRLKQSYESACRQLGLFDLRKDYEAKRNEMKRRLRLIQGGGQKRCRDCRELMDVEQFYLDNSRFDKRDVYCIECRAERARRAYAKRKGNVIARGAAA